MVQIYGVDWLKRDWDNIQTNNSTFKIIIIEVIEKIAYVNQKIINMSNLILI